MELNAETLKSIIDLGMSGLLLYFLGVIWKDKIEERKEAKQSLENEKKDSQICIANKDNYIKDMHKEVLEVVKENTKTQENLRATIQEHIKVTETLTNRIYEVLNK